MQDVAYGSRDLKIKNDFSIEMPNVVRLVNPAKIVQDYKYVCNKEGINALNERTCFKILKECEASYSKCLRFALKFHFF